MTLAGRRVAAGSGGRRGRLLACRLNAAQSDPHATLTPSESQATPGSRGRPAIGRLASMNHDGRHGAARSRAGRGIGKDDGVVLSARSDGGDRNRPRRPVRASGARDRALATRRGEVRRRARASGLKFNAAQI